MSINPTSSDLQLLWDSYINFEACTRDKDGDLNLFIEDWKEKMDKVQSAGCQYSDLLLGFKLVEKVRLSHDSIVSVISNLASATFSSDSFLSKVVTTIKKEFEIRELTDNDKLEKDIQLNECNLEISADVKNKCNLVSYDNIPVKLVTGRSSIECHLQDPQDLKPVNSKDEFRSESGFLKCPICDKNFMLIETLEKHGKSHDDVIFCDKSSVEQPVVDAGIDDEVEEEENILKAGVKKEIKKEGNKESKSKKGPEKNFKCRICLKEYEKLWMVTKHMEVHKTTRDHQCSHCDNTYKGKDGLRKHLLKMHSKEQSESKEHYDSSIKLKIKQNLVSEDLQKGKNVHGGRRKLPCEICGKYISEDGIRIHIKRHLNELKCNTCPMKFSKPSMLQKHMEAHHQSHNCSFCQKQFKAAKLLKIHMESHRTTRDFICSYCGKKFKTNGPLREHLNVHTKAKQLPCQYCDKTFLRRNSLKYHIRAHHTGEKPYKCDFCDKRFYISTKKVEHMRIHTGEKPFPCHICGKSFRDSNTRKRHIRNVHKEEKPNAV